MEESTQCHLRLFLGLFRTVPLVVLVVRASIVVTLVAVALWSVSSPLVTGVGFRGHEVLPYDTSCVYVFQEDDTARW